MTTLAGSGELTYQQRIDALRETKMRQTREKQQSDRAWTMTKLVADPATPPTGASSFN